MGMNIAWKFDAMRIWSTKMNTAAEGRRSRRIRLLPRKAAARGFTILELMITVGIIAIVAGIAYPSLNRMMVNGYLRSAARDIMGDMAALKERAMAENTQYSIVFDPAHNNYSFPGIPAGKSPTAFGQGIQLTGAAFGAGTTATFLTRGTLQQGGNVTLVNSRGSTATITCIISGRTYVQFTMQ
jgi:type IV pilus assembly protein PilE